MHGQRRRREHIQKIDKGKGETETREAADRDTGGSRGRDIDRV